MNKQIVGLVAAVFSLAIGQSAFANSDWCGQRLEKIVMIASLKVDPAQKEKIKPILEQLKVSLEDKAAQMKELRTKINEQLNSDTMDQATVDSLIDKKAALIGDMMKAKAKARHEVIMALTPAQ